eukprot:CAMPEP_0174270976 /NCGR_PEP_ID=MMETSP0439-20130205/46359_1 /TAXON_ID=0 /ORGANISM="Stereomyxa ramosa, Strain Chinc5" /LENGTH=278 /DNA_ID=CAMNT_0015360675 /DNA_START=592 /DNA_END=1428 /DNA_ORIENTATION=+
MATFVVTKNNDKKIIIFGGYDEQGVYHYMSIFDIESCSWRTLSTSNIDPNLYPTLRCNSASCLVDNKWYIFGGSAHGKSLNDLWVLDTETLEWEELKPTGMIPSHRTCSIFLCFRNKLFLYGGGNWDTSERLWKEGYNDIHIFDIELNEWKKLDTTGELPKPTTNVAPCNLGKNFLYFYGGADVSSGFTCAKHYVLDTVNGRWSTICPLEFTAWLRRHNKTNWTWVNATYSQPTHHKIPAKDGCTASNIGNKIYIYGGFSSAIHCVEIHPEHELSVPV